MYAVELSIGICSSDLESALPRVPMCENCHEVCLRDIISGSAMSLSEQDYRSGARQPRFLLLSCLLKLVRYQVKEPVIKATTETEKRYN